MRALIGSAIVAAGLLWTAAGIGPVAAQAPAAPRFLDPTPVAGLFFREPWRQSAPMDASTGFRPEGGVTAAAVTNPLLEMKVYDPLAKNVPAYLKNPPPGTIAVDWHGPSCVQLAGYNQNPPPARVVAGAPSDPPNLWTGVCGTGVAVTLRHKESFANLTGLGARIRWVTRTSGFHVVRPVVRLADGSYYVGDSDSGGQSANSQLFVESEVALGNVRWLALDIDRIVTRGDKWATPDLRRVDEIGFADLHPGSGHGWGGFVNVARIEVFGAAVKR
jgi:hypothetical protein